MKVLFITGKKNKVQDVRMHLLRKFMPFECDIHSISESKRNKNFKGYDLIYYTQFSLAANLPLRGKKIASITSHKCLDELKKTRQIIRQFEGMSVNNTILLKKLSPYIPNIHYTPNGVDTKFFNFKDKIMSSRPVIGWVGNKDRRTKNFKSIVRPLRSSCKEFDVKIVATSKRDAKNPFSMSQMRDYYHGLDFFLVSSSTEGTPNPALEAMSCGVPVITTPVGNMIEIVEEGVNGIFVNPDYSEIVEKLESLVTLSSEKYKQLRINARSKIEPWDWSIKSKLWVDFFENYC